MVSFINILLSKLKPLCLFAALLLCVCAELPKDYCGDNNHFDPNTHFCFEESETIKRCGGDKEYNPINEACDADINKVFFVRSPEYLIGWSNPFSDSLVRNTMWSRNITLNEHNRLVIFPLANADANRSWELQLLQKGFNHNHIVGANAGTHIYEVIISGFTTDGSVSFNLDLGSLELVECPPSSEEDECYDYTNYAYSSGVTTVDGVFNDVPFTMLQGEHLSDPDADFTIAFAYPGNGTLTLTALSIRKLVD